MRTPGSDSGRPCITVGRVRLDLVRGSATICVLLCLFFFAGKGFTQYDEEPVGETPDSLRDSVQSSTAIDVAPTPPTPEQLEAAELQQSVELAKTWVRRMLVRGWVNPTHIGSWSTYSLTDWSEATGSYGPVEAKLTFHYLGPAEWMRHEAESFQAAFEVMDIDHTMIEFDLLVPATPKVSEIYRALMRVDRGDLTSVTLAPPAGVLDYDGMDKPTTGGPRHIKIYSGEYDAEIFRGSGVDGAEVVIYRTAAVLPLEILVLGYGDVGMTFSSSGNTITPRFKATLPPSR